MLMSDYYRKKMMKYYENMTPGQKRAEMERRERSCKRIKFITIKIPAALSMLFLLYLFVTAGIIMAFRLVIVLAVVGTPWCLWWNWIADMELK